MSEKATLERRMRESELREVQIDHRIADIQLRLEALERGDAEGTPPSDHIDRFWIVGAWIVFDGLPNTIYTPINENDAMYWSTERGQCGKMVERGKRASETGWSFHPDSPIQEQRKP